MRRWITALFLLLRFALIGAQLCNPLAGLFNLNLFGGGGGGCGGCCPPPLPPPNPCCSSPCAVPVSSGCGGVGGGYPSASSYPSFSPPYPLPASNYGPPPSAQSYSAPQQVPPSPGFGYGGSVGAGGSIPTQFAGPVPPAPSYGQLPQPQPQVQQQPQQLPPIPQAPPPAGGPVTSYILQQVSPSNFEPRPEQQLPQLPPPRALPIPGYRPSGKQNKWTPQSNVGTVLTSSQKVSPIQVVAQSQKANSYGEEQGSANRNGETADYQNEQNQEKQEEYDLEEEPAQPDKPASKPISPPTGPVPPPPPTDYQEEEEEDEKPNPPAQVNQPDKGSDYQEPKQPPPSAPQTSAPDYVLNFPKAAPISTPSPRQPNPYSPPVNRPPPPYQPPVDQESEAGAEYDDELDQPAPQPAQISHPQSSFVPPAPPPPPRPAPVQPPQSKPLPSPVLTTPPLPSTPQKQTYNMDYSEEVNQDSKEQGSIPVIPPAPQPSGFSDRSPAFPSSSEHFEAQVVPGQGHQTAGPASAGAGPDADTDWHIDPKAPISIPPPPPPKKLIVPPKPIENDVDTEFGIPDDAGKFHLYEDHSAVSSGSSPSQATQSASSTPNQAAQPAPWQAPPTLLSPEPIHLPMPAPSGNEDQQSVEATESESEPENYVGDTEWHVDPKEPITIPQPSAVSQTKPIVQQKVTDDGVDTGFGIPDKAGNFHLFEDQKEETSGGAGGGGVGQSAPQSLPAQLSAVPDGLAPSGYSSSLRKRRNYRIPKRPQIKRRRSSKMA